ncbi:hypothetical protein [Nonomuraea typhae]|uniref:hypothetical protein n=1 Tax=Nonomuraea typhae TaxID=2603600 RepID=UPI0012F93070|nr:hypothetical protein [Nonomuraea typhae]
MRCQLFDLDSEPLPEHLCEALIDTMEAVYGNAAPRIPESDPAYHDDGSGRPNNAALQQMWQVVYRYLKMVASDGLEPGAPVPPSLINDHAPPIPPGFTPRFTFDVPCTVPEFYDEDKYNKGQTQPAYDPRRNLSLHYLDDKAPHPGRCAPKPVTGDQIEQAKGLAPEGEGV